MALRIGKTSIGKNTVWLFDLDNTLHDASASVFGALKASMGAYTARTLQLPLQEAQQINDHYWLRYGATLLGLMRHHGVQPAHFLHDTHHLPGLEADLSRHMPIWPRWNACQGANLS